MCSLKHASSPLDQFAKLWALQIFKSDPSVQSLGLLETTQVCLWWMDSFLVNK